MQTITLPRADIITVREIRAITGAPLHRIHYAISRYGPPASGLIGTARIWCRSDLPAIQEALRKTAENCTRGEPAK